MFPIRTILHPNDFSGYSEEAFQLAYSLARDYKARLVVLHVAPPPLIRGDFLMTDTEQQFRKTLEVNVTRLQGKGFPVEVEYLVHTGDPAETILDQAKETNADLIVMGTHGRTGFNRMLMGSVAERVLRHSPCPVVTVKQPFTESQPVQQPVRVAEESVVTLF